MQLRFESGKVVAAGPALAAADAAAEGAVQGVTLEERLLGRVQADGLASGDV
jgi:hypothetical protein